jgi:hypothetical protein
MPSSAVTLKDSNGRSFSARKVVNHLLNAVMSLVRRGRSALTLIPGYMSLHCPTEKSPTGSDTSGAQALDVLRNFCSAIRLADL